MNTGELRWTVANCHGPRNHPLLKDLKLPALGTLRRPVLVMTRSLLFVGEGSDAINYSAVAHEYGPHFRAYDDGSGEVLADVELPTGTTGAPITYAVKGQHSSRISSLQ
jgi:hypothetical protein